MLFPFLNVKNIHIFAIDIARMQVRDDLDIFCHFVGYGSKLSGCGVLFSIYLISRKEERGLNDSR